MDASRILRSGEDLARSGRVGHRADALECGEGRADLGAGQLGVTLRLIDLREQQQDAGSLVLEMTESY